MKKAIFAASLAIACGSALADEASTEKAASADSAAKPFAIMVMAKEREGFGTVQVGTSSTATFVVANAGSPMETPVRMTAPKGVSLSGCDKPLGTGDKCSVKAVWKPRHSGVLSGSLAVFAEGSEFPVKSKLAGSAVPSVGSR